MKNLLIIALVLLIIGCASPYVGQPVHYNNKAVCKCPSLPKSCSVGYDHLTIKYTISEGNTPGEYVFSGTVNWVGGVGWTSSSSGVLRLLLGKGVVVDDVSFGISINMERPTEFKRTFKTEHDFDSVIVGYSMNVRG